MEAALAAAGLAGGPLDPDELAPLDQFHAGGRGATLALARLAGLTAGDRVLDAGAGLGGPARLLAKHVGCRVTALEVAEPYARLSAHLTERAGLADRVEAVLGDALAPPFADGSFDVAWLQHVSMAVRDKARLFAELRRVLRPGGRLALFEVVAGEAGGVRYPAPWAEGPDTSFLAAPAELRRLVACAGFAVDAWEDVTAEARGWFERVRGAPQRPLGLHLVVPGLIAKVANVVRNLDEGRIGVVRGLGRAV